MQVISVIVPAYNESHEVFKAYEAIVSVFDKDLPEYGYEILFVDDGSADDTFDCMEEVCRKDQRAKALKFLNNCGAHTAIRAGLENSTGDMAVFLACDLQDPPEIIPTMVKELKKPFDIVLAVRSTRDDSLKDRSMSRLFFSLMRRFVSDKLPSEGSSMYLVSSKVVGGLRLLQEKNLTLESMFILLNFKHTKVFYERRARESGKSKWTFSKKVKMVVDFFVAYSYSPIRFVTFIGLFISLLGILWGSYIVVRTIFIGDMAPGWPALISIILIGFGVTNFSLGIIAEYLWRTLDETRKRPRFIIEKKINI
jgi:glycosyltransferase involved in cell wall biosynthesis